MHHIKEYNQSPLVLVNGYGLDKSSWRSQVDFFSSTFQVELYDFMFREDVKRKNAEYLKVCVDEIGDFINSLPYSKVHFVGQSVAGMLGLALSVKQPSLFKSLTMIGSSPCYINKKDYFGGFGQEDVDTVFWQMSKDYLGWLFDFSKLATQGHSEIADYMVRVLETKNPAESLFILRAIFELDFRHLLNKVSVPSYIISLTNDPIVPQDVSKFMSAAINGSKLKFIEGAGHHPQMSHADIINEEIQGFISGIN